MDDAFLAALFPGRRTILGFRLQPYCHGHVAALCAVDSPFVADDSSTTAGAGDLILALRICRAPGWPLPTPDEFQPRLRDAFLRWWLERSPERLQTAVDAFVSYQDAHRSFPEFYSNDPTGADEIAPAGTPSGRTLTAPFVLARVCSLISRTNIPEERAWRMPLALPSWYGGTLAELAGEQIRFLDEGEDDGTDLPPDVDQMGEEAIHAQAVQHLGAQEAQAWMSARQSNRKAEA